jgi:hypothetical protein
MGRRSQTSATPTATGLNPPVATTPTRPRRRRGADARGGAERADRREGPPGKPTTTTSAGEPRTGHEPPDAEWLASLPVRAALKDPAAFDRDALIFRSVQRFRTLLPAELQPTELECQKASTLYLAVAEGRFSFLMAFVWNAPPPERWIVCSRCQGAGTVGSPGATCLVCEGGGFEMPLP